MLMLKELRRDALGLALPSTASTPRYVGARQTGHRDRMASQGLSHLLAMEITSFWMTQDERRNPRPDPPDELMSNCSSSASISVRP
jgi:hypothetical protein